MPSEPIDPFEYEVAHSLIPGSSEQPSYSDVLYALQDALYDRDRHAERWKKSLKMMDSLKEQHSRELSAQREDYEERLKKERDSYNFFVSLSDTASKSAERSYHSKTRLLILASSLITSGLVTNWMSPYGATWQVPIVALIFSVPAIVLCTFYSMLFLTDKIEKPRVVDYLIIVGAFLISLIL